jgi:hypothetical protein
MPQIDDTQLEGLERIYELKQKTSNKFSQWTYKSQAAATDTLITQELDIRTLDDLGNRWRK